MQPRFNLHRPITARPRPVVKRTIEAPEYRAFAIRIIKALAARGARDEYALQELATVQAQVTASMRWAVEELRGRGVPLSRIADALGISKQAVHQRFGK